MQPESPSGVAASVDASGSLRLIPVNNYGEVVKAPYGVYSYADNVFQIAAATAVDSEVFSLAVADDDTFKAHIRFIHIQSSMGYIDAETAASVLFELAIVKGATTGGALTVFKFNSSQTASGINFVTDIPATTVASLGYIGQPNRFGSNCELKRSYDSGEMVLMPGYSLVLILRNTVPQDYETLAILVIWEEYDL